MVRRHALLVLLSLTLIFALTPLDLANAKSNSDLTLIENKTYELNGEQFILETWEDANGNLSYTIPTEVNDKASVSEFTDKLLQEKSPITPQGEIYNWYRDDMKEYDRKADLSWSTRGFSDWAYLYPATANVMGVKKGKIKATWQGRGNADKIVVNYRYTFKGTTLILSAPPSISFGDDVVDWTSEPFENTWYTNIPTEAASVSSRTFITGINLYARADIYVGSDLYRPVIRDTVNWLES